MGKTKDLQQSYVNDFDFLHQAVQDEYAYLDTMATDWSRVRDLYHPQIVKAQTKAEFIALLEQVLDELYDAHAQLNTNLASSWRLVPTGADVWAEWRGNRAVVTEVRLGSRAERAGVRAGAEIVAVNGTSVRQATEERLGKCLRHPEPAADDWALRSVLAGRRNVARTWEVRQEGKSRIIAVDAAEMTPVAQSDKTLLDVKQMGTNHDVGYVRFHNSLGDNALIAQFDTALDRCKDTRGLILDLRDTPSGGNTTVARAIMGRFVDRDRFFQKHERPEEQRAFGVKRSWVELVSPRGMRYTKPVVVLVDHWTGSMGEGITIGMDGMKRARIVGTHMAGLRGSLETFTLPNTGIRVSFPTERLYHVSGMPRENFTPSVSVNLEKTGGQSSDAILDAGLKALHP